MEGIELLKSKGIDTYTITCESGESCVLSQPSIKTTAKILPILMAEKNADFLQAGKIIITDCWVSGDDAIRTDENLNAEVALAALGIIQLKVASVKKN